MKLRTRMLIGTILAAGLLGAPARLAYGGTSDSASSDSDKIKKDKEKCKKAQPKDKQKTKKCEPKEESGKVTCGPEEDEGCKNALGDQSGGSGN